MLPPNWAMSELNMRCAGQVAVTQNGVWTALLSCSAFTAASNPSRSSGSSEMPAFSRWAVLP